MNPIPDERRPARPFPRLLLLLIAVRKRRPTIAQTLPDSPARSAGLKPGDVLLRIDGKDVDNLSLEQIVQRVRGPAGTQVRLTVLREGTSQPLDFTITRARVQVA